MVPPGLHKSSINEGEIYETWLKSKGQVEYMDRVYNLHGGLAEKKE